MLNVVLWEQRCMQHSPNECTIFVRNFSDPSDNWPEPPLQVYKDVLKTLYQALHNMYSATILSLTN